MTVSAQIGIIGGSGLYKMSALTNIQEVNIDTPFGKTSDALIYGELSGTSVLFLARHGRSHHLLPSEVPYRANIYAMKSLGVEYIISASAVGSLQEYARPLDIVLPDQFIDRTNGRTATFFGEGVVAHVAFAEPICKALLSVVASAAENIDLGRNKVHKGGIYLCMEGPAFSTKAESLLYRSWGAKVIGMTNLTEAKLAREAEIAYATIALVTDYDCWHDDHESVTVEMVVQNLQKNAANAQKVIQNAVAKIAANPPKSEAHHALKTSILTDLAQISDASRDRLKVILQKYL
ncbi:S-methyl-5'-thioadenosine phosphorylase [Pseudanabaena sp. FACHB-1277]|uniref:S-methyl-5'-thioadenosine phosphorylase n=1 Tax=Pseudanabaena cinerea FACHB-1277 TaxID=2949581 RepID=A0A926Z604_9CYAN|nr:S-methyl-5'-thioadenosine phosphorylase [Pseudanabaena cinerea]MBD2150157.1 S-methyl-5'-thioadenosine phosphorylase [Pseudanabaena cinerea FACHB-1277]